MSNQDTERAAFKDEFRGDNAALLASIAALLSLDAAGALVPHGIGGHACGLLNAAASRLRATAPEVAHEPVAALVRHRYLRTPASLAVDGQDHFSDWEDWTPGTLEYANAVTDPARNNPVIWEMRPLFAGPAPRQEPAAPSARITAKPLEWTESRGEWSDKHFGFYVMRETDPTDADKPWSAALGEGDSEDFATLEEAKAWCQQQAEHWVSAIAHLTGAAPQDDSKAPAALQPTGNECVTWEFCNGSDKQFMRVSMGHGRIEVGDGQHLGLPALWFGNDGQGLGVERNRNAQAEPGESLVIFTFANLQGLEAIEFALARVRKNMGAAPPAQKAAAAQEAACQALIDALRALPVVRHDEFDGEESDGTPQRWRQRPFVSLRKVERLIQAHPFAHPAPHQEPAAPSEKTWCAHSGRGVSEYAMEGAIDKDGCMRCGACGRLVKLIENTRPFPTFSHRIPRHIAFPVGRQARLSNLSWELAKKLNAFAGNAAISDAEFESSLRLLLEPLNNLLRAAPQEDAELQTLRDRDAYHEWADRLANAIAQHLAADIGEHSSDNNPWQRAEDAIFHAAKPAAQQDDSKAPAADLHIALQSFKALREALLPSFEMVGVSLRVSQEDHAAIRSALAGASTGITLLEQALSAAPTPVHEAASHLQAVVKHYNEMHAWRLRHECEEPEPRAERKETLHRMALALAMHEATKFLAAPADHEAASQGKTP